jgi:hypothetical protein
MGAAQQSGLGSDITVGITGGLSASIGGGAIGVAGSVSGYVIFRGDGKVAGGFVITCEANFLNARFRMSIHIGYNPDKEEWYLKPLMPLWLESYFKGWNKINIFNPRNWKRGYR